MIRPLRSRRTPDVSVGIPVLNGGALFADVLRSLARQRVEHELVAYPEAAHGFACAERPEAYDDEATTDAWRRVLAVLGERVAATGQA